MKNVKGYTLVELLVALVIVSLVAVLIMTYLTVNITNASMVKNNTELQFQAQYILNFVSEKVMVSKNVELIHVGISSAINSNQEQSITRISLRYGDNPNYCYLFRVADKKIFYGKGKSTDLASSELGTYVKEIKAKPYPEGKSFREAIGLRITVIVVKGNEEYAVSQIIKMMIN